MDLSSSSRLSLPTLDTLVELHDELHRRGVQLWLARIRSTARPIVEASDLADRFRPALHPDVAAAVNAYTSADHGHLA